MASVIDALVVTLGLDATKFKQGSKETDQALKKTSEGATKTAKDMDAWGKNAAIAIGKLRNEVLGLLAVFTAGAGIKGFVQNTVQSATELKNLSENIGISTQDITAWGRANEMAGGSVAGMTAQLQESSKAVAAYKVGLMDEGTRNSFSYLHLNSDDLKDGTTYLKARIKAIGELYKTDPSKAQLYAGMAGMTPETFNLAKQGVDVTMKMVDAQRTLSQMSKSDADRLDGLRRSWVQFQNTLTDIAQKILVALTPALQGVMAQFNTLAAWMDQHRDEISAWITDAIAKLIPMVKSLATAFSNIDWKTVGQQLRTVGDAFGHIADGLRVVLDLWGKFSGSPILNFLSDKLTKNSVYGQIPTLLGKAVDIAKSVTGGQAKSNEQSGKLGGAPASGASATLFESLEKKHGLPSGVLDAMWQQESGRGKNMLSPKGAKGHFQFMDATAAQYGVTDPNNLEMSATGAAKMLRHLLDQNGGNLPKALAGYNWGSGNLARKGIGAAPDETLKYIEQITRRMEPAARQAGGNTSTSETNIGQITVQTSATDAAGIARSIGGAVQTVAMSSQSNRGMD